MSDDLAQVRRHQHMIADMVAEYRSLGDGAPATRRGLARKLASEFAAHALLAAAALPALSFTTVPEMAFDEGPGFERSLATIETYLANETAALRAASL